MSGKKRFVPVRGTEEHIMNPDLGFHDGYLYIATDTGHMYIDCFDSEGNRQPRTMVGGAAGGSGNSGIYYANRILTTEEKTDPIIEFRKSEIEGSDYPVVDDIIINIPEGAFYRVTNPSQLTSSVFASRLTIAGGGGGASSLEEDVDIEFVEPFLVNTNLINGHDAFVYFVAHSAKNAKGKDKDQILTITWQLQYTEDRTNFNLYKTGNFTVIPEEVNEFNFGVYARPSAISKLILTVAGSDAHAPTASITQTFTTSSLELSLDSSFSNVRKFTSNSVSILCNTIGKMDKKIEYYCDDMEHPFYTEQLDENTDQVEVDVADYVALSHGTHRIKIRLFQLVNGQKNFEADPPLDFEIGVDDEESAKPIIWLGPYKETYYNYDVIQIPFRVQTRTGTARVHFQKNGRELDNSPQDITDNSKFSYFEIADAKMDEVNIYTISCGEGDNETIRTISINIIQDPKRKDFEIKWPKALTYSLNTIGSGRSNNESEIKRQTLVFNDIAAKFSNFNWYNNGWARDDKDRTCLRISNGASLSIPIGEMQFAKAGGTDIETSHTIEIMFRVRNVQDYSNLIHNITRYVNDTAYYNEFYDEATSSYKTKYTNYDSFLAWYLKENEIINPSTGERVTYDDLEFQSIQKQSNLNNVFCGYYSGSGANVVGMCLGPQDMFFSDGTDTVSASYVEDEIVTLSIVYQHHETNPAQRLIMIYINGILTSVSKNTVPDADGFTIESENIVFNSNTCDIDLYKLRVYKKTLDVNDIVVNYAVDFSNVDVFDQNKLARKNNTIEEYQFLYENMRDYNLEHPNEPLMPYIVFDTTQSYADEMDKQKLSYSKAVKLNIGVEFVNTPLEVAYANGELEGLAIKDGLCKATDNAATKLAAVKKYYQYHCPSWVSGVYVDEDQNVDAGVQMAVQGTSSEFYPRRNYKLKAKTKYDADKEERIHIFLNKGPFEADFLADSRGVQADKFILSTEAFDSSKTYYLDPEGKNKVNIPEDRPYEFDTFYIQNPEWVQVGKEKTRQKYWYMNNYTTGTTKWTMKIDFMESSGSYNMGFANLVKNGYSKHPLDDYNNAHAFVEEVIDYTQSNGYTAGTTYAYKDSSNKWQTISLDSEEDPAAAYALGPVGYAATQEAMSVGTDNHWYDINKSYPEFNISKTEDYRTSIAGFRVLAFHKKYISTQTKPYYQFIGMYNMLLDKGSDEVYGFKPDKTSGGSPLQKFIKNKKISKIAECWEFENNNRTYCSFRDPDKRKDLTFKAFDNATGNYKLNSVRSAPLVADSFEYRYHDEADALDYIMDPLKEADKIPDETFRFNKDDPTENFETRANFLWDKYKNWEKACQWVWSTCTDYVISQGEYEQIYVGETLWKTGELYIVVNDEFVLDNSSTWDITKDYYIKKQESQTDDEGNTTVVDVYVNAHAADDAHLFKNIKGNLYINLKENSPTDTPDYVSCANDPEFNDSYIYYILNNYSDTELANKEAAGLVDRLVRKATADDVYDADNIYTYDGNQTNGHATTKVTPTQAEFDAVKGTDDAYYIGITVDDYMNKEYKYDTKEYRGDKFIYDLSKHFDIEYMATYFVMTEVFECYDSRGKNCMMASWGPQSANGDYIWYPIFYDIDTQLGVNNTGIPSFEYNVDATEDGNYSTSDSVLWNNFYKYFKSSAILSKYKHLRGVTSGVPEEWGTLKPAPLKSVDFIEGWYNTDPEICGQIVMRGKRPIVAKNLDEYYKYITITNGSDATALADGLIGHLSSDPNGSGEYTVDPDGKYFYMLQGDRSLSRRQFLDNRLEFIDSWLNQGNYQRGGANRIRGRVSANKSDRTSDKWVESPQDPYYDNEGNKRHPFDAEYWLTLTPTHSSYVTLGDDNEAYPSKKYDGIHPLKFEVSAIESGVRTSNNYPEQLLYIYGINNMSDLGDMSKLYWQEFAIEGKAPKLTSLKFGYDGIVRDINPATGQMEDMSYQNRNVNNPTFGAAKIEGATGLPLLKYMNMCNVQIKDAGSSLNLTSCEKLENFRATGSNITEVQFAEGVALNTLYLPESITALRLTEARLLKNLITEYHAPVLNAEGDLVAEPGLYLENMFEGNGVTNISILNILGSGLGYNSYKLLKRYYDIRKRQSASPSNIQMTKVQWSPYIQVSTDEDHLEDVQYYKDNGHFKLEPYSFNYNTWPIEVANGEIYRLDESIAAADIQQISDIDMLRRFADVNDNLFRTNISIKVPNITGIIYIDNSDRLIKVTSDDIYNETYEYYEDNAGTIAYTYNASNWSDKVTAGLWRRTFEYDELDIRNNIKAQFPNLTFFFARVDEAYTAKFLLMDADSGNDGTYKEVGSQTIRSGWFANPYEVYADTRFDQLKPNYIFNGWAATNALDATLFTNTTWAAQSLNPDVHTYYFYAICKLRTWPVKFYDGNDLFFTDQVGHGQHPTMPAPPYKDDSDCDLDKTYKLLGYSVVKNGQTLVDFSKEIVSDDSKSYYAVWAHDEEGNITPVSVYENVQPDLWEIVDKFGSNNDDVVIKLAKDVIGKITIPATLTDSAGNVKIVRALRSNNTGNSTADSHLINVTHVFVEPINEDGDVNLRSIAENTFRSCSNLKYIELDAKGLTDLGQRIFQDVGNLELIHYVGGTISSIPGHCFNSAFNNTKNLEILIDGNIIGMGVRAFQSFGNSSTPSVKIQIGTETNKTKITYFPGGGDVAFRNVDSAVTELVIWFDSSVSNNSIYSSDNDYANLKTALFGTTNLPRLTKFTVNGLDII